MGAKSTSFLLSFISGFIDTAGFIVLSGLFTAHITGNLVLAGASLINDNNPEVAARLAMLPVFVIGVMAAFILTTVLARTLNFSLTILLVVQAVLTIVFSMLGSFLENDAHQILSPLQVFLVGTVGVFAMCIQNTYMKTHLSSHAPTTVMTGNLTQFSIDLVNVFLIKLDMANLSSSKSTQGELTLAINQLGLSLLGFLVGAMAGALLVANVGLISCLLPASFLCALSMYSKNNSL